MAKLLEGTLWTIRFFPRRVENDRGQRIIKPFKIKPFQKALDADANAALFKNRLAHNG